MVQVFHFVTLSLFTTFILWHAESGFALRWGQGGGRVMMRGEGSRLIGEPGGMKNAIDHQQGQMEESIQITFEQGEIFFFKTYT